jgi:hypothetical protein
MLQKIRVYFFSVPRKDKKELVHKQHRQLGRGKGKKVVKIADG